MPSTVDEMLKVLPLLYYRVPRSLKGVLGETQVGILLILVSKGGVCRSDKLRKAFWEQLTSARLASHTARLRKNHYIHQTPDPDNLTLNKVRLLKRGKNTAVAVLRKWASFIEECFSELSPAEQSRLVGLFLKVANAFDRHENANHQ